MSTFPRHIDQTATRPAPEISEERRQTVETARRSWIRKLIDLSRRNNHRCSTFSGTRECGANPTVVRRWNTAITCSVPR